MSSGPKVGLVDYGAGNYTSVLNALEYIGCRVDAIRRPNDLKFQERIILPGVGAFPTSMRRLDERGFVEPLRQLTGSDVPFLGICVGMQLLATIGREFEDHSGLDLIPGEVRRIEANGLRLPHIGWNSVVLARHMPLFEGLSDEPTFYFVHGYHLVPTDPGAVLATCDYGGRVTAVVGVRNVYGVQFHPEKSQQAGLRLLWNFATMQPSAQRSVPLATAG